MKKIDYILQIVQLYSYLLPTVKIGNAIMDFREKHTMDKLGGRRKARKEQYGVYSN